MVNFNFSFAPGTTLQQMVGFEMAGRVWSSFLSDPISVNIHVGVSNDLPANVIGGALPGIRSSQAYQEVYRGLLNDRSSILDVISVDNLNNKSEYEAWFDEFDRKNGKNVGEKAKTKAISLTRANARAMGLLSGSSELDGVIVFGGLTGTNFRWNYDFARSSSAPAGTLDFLSTALHEIGHILGFVSGIDKAGWLNSRAPDKVDLELYKDSLKSRVTYTTPLDLFRYSNVAGRGINDLSYGSIGSDKYFSIDGGQTSLAQFSTGLDGYLGGDGLQASHWKGGGSRVGIMSPTLSPQERPWISTLDLIGLDVTGWNMRQGVTNLNLNLSSLRSQAEQRISQRLGVTVDWMNQNSVTAAQRLVRDRTADIDDMIRKSEVYEWGTRPTSSGTSSTSPWRQVIDLLNQRVVYSSFATLDSEFALDGAMPVLDPNEEPLMSAVQRVISANIGTAEADQDLGASVSSVEKILPVLALNQLEIFMPASSPNSVMPQMEARSISFETVGMVITPGQIDVKEWLDRIERSIRQKKPSAPASQLRNGTENTSWEMMDWSAV